MTQKIYLNYINKGTLFVEVSNSTWRQELQFQKKDIIEKLNKEIKEKIVREIKFK